MSSPSSQLAWCGSPQAIWTTLIPSRSSSPFNSAMLLTWRLQLQTPSVQGARALPEGCVTIPPPRPSGRDQPGSRADSFNPEMIITTGSPAGDHHPRSFADSPSIHETSQRCGTGEDDALRLLDDLGGRRELGGPGLARGRVGGQAADDDAVSPFRLGAVEGGISRFDEAIGPGRSSGRRVGQAGADGHADLADGGADATGGHVPADAIGAIGGQFGRGDGQRDDEFLTAEAGHEVLGAR